MKLPNFLIIGAAKSGTTALYHYIKQHPDIYMSPLKETEFFAFEGDNLAFRGPGDMPRATITSIEDYLTLFSGQTKESAIGEASPAYLYSLKAPHRIYHYIPEAKIICLLRDPIERAYSQYVMFIRDGREPLTDFSKALQEEKKRIQDNWAWGWHYTQTGLYYTQLKRYFDLFDRSQIKVYLYDDLAKDSSALIQDVFRFIGVDDSFKPNTQKRHNISGIPKNLILHRFLTQSHPIKETLKPLLPQKMRKQLTGELRDKNLSKPMLSTEDRQSLLPIFGDEILNLQNLIQRDLSAWLV